MNRPCISLLTDFDLHDTYLGQMKGIIAGINPDAVVVDLTKLIAQQISQATLALADSLEALSEFGSPPTEPLKELALLGSPSARTPGLFVTGTDTNIGKTHVATLIVRALRTGGHRVGAYKPVCSGAVLDSAGVARWEDIDRLRAALQVDCPDDAICPQRFLAPLAPPLAAKAEGRTVDFERLVSGTEWWRGKVDLLIAEGAGGLLAPVTETETAADLARAFGFPLLIVARCGLGTINHTLLTVEAARQRGLSIAGIVLNQCHPDDDRRLAEANAAEIEARGNVAVLGNLDWGASDGLHRHGRPVTIPWSDLAG